MWILTEVTDNGKAETIFPTAIDAMKIAVKISAAGGHAWVKNFKGEDNEN